MLHEEVADRVPGRLEAAGELEGEDGSVGNYPTAIRARTLRLTATVTEEEPPPPMAQARR